MEFKRFKKQLQDHFEEMTKDAPKLFEVAVDKDELWNLYLDSFPEGTNKIYRERREYDCSCCRHFIKSIGNAVIIKNNQVHTIWEFQTGSSTFQPVVEALDRYIKAHAISDVYVSKLKAIGTDHNREEVDGKINVYEHFFLILPDKFVDRSYRSEGDIKGSFRDVRNVFKRSLDEISQQAIETVLELIMQNSLYKGEEWKGVLTEFLRYKRDYEKISESERENYAWEKSVTAGAVIGKIRNHSIGTLLVNISEGMELDLAVRKYEQIVAPANYKRPKAIYTKKMLEEAQKTVEELGYMDSLSRRFAKLDDITVNNILFSNRDAARRISGNVFEDMAAEVTINPKRFSKVEEIGIEQFVKDVLPTAKELEVYFENKHRQNMVSLIAPQNPESPSMFKWNNPFSWAYTGNMTDSDIRENVKMAGGSVDGVLRFSIQWNDEDYNPNDFDAHCESPKFHIFFGSKRDGSTGGNLDVDIICPQEGKAAVENITWPDKSKMIPGTYKFYVNCFSQNGGRSGFKAEIEFDGQIYSFDYPHSLRQGEDVVVAEVTLSRDGVFSIKELLPSNISSHEVWGLKTNQFVPVSVVCYSPNYWDEQNGIGHRHVFFMLKDCVNPEMPNGFYNEFLKQELVQHKRVFEALGGKMRVDDVDDQLSGVGFSTTKRAELVVKVKGATERILKVKF